MVSRYIYGSCFLNLSYITKSLIISILSIISFVLMAVASYESSNIFYFYLAIVASVFTGLS
jgi:hypothetical protein